MDSCAFHASDILINLQHQHLSNIIIKGKKERYKAFILSRDIT